jgi:putative intracellular protease/amidase
VERVLMLAGDAVEDLEALGGTFVDGPDVVDGNLVSCRGWGDLAGMVTGARGRARAGRGSRVSPSR